MEIIIQDNLLSTLTRLATEQNITPEEYIQNYMTAHLFSQFKAELVDIVNKQTIENLDIMKSIAIPAIEAVEVKIAEEKTRLIADAEKLIDPING